MYPVDIVNFKTQQGASFLFKKGNVGPEINGTGRDTTPHPGGAEEETPGL